MRCWRFCCFLLYICFLYLLLQKNRAGWLPKYRTRTYCWWGKSLVVNHRFWRWNEGRRGGGKEKGMLPAAASFSVNYTYPTGREREGLLGSHCAWLKRHFAFWLHKSFSLCQELCFCRIGKKIARNHICPTLIFESKRQKPCGKGQLGSKIYNLQGVWYHTVKAQKMSSFKVITLGDKASWNGMWIGQHLNIHWWTCKRVSILICF